MEKTISGVVTKWKGKSFRGCHEFCHEMESEIYFPRLSRKGRNDIPTEKESGMPTKILTNNSRYMFLKRVIKHIIALHPNKNVKNVR